MEESITIEIPYSAADDNREYRIVGLTVFIISIALLVMRLISYYIQVALIDNTMDPAWYELLLDALFSVPVQIGLLFVFPFLMYKLALKKKAIGVLEFSGYRKCNVWVCLLSVLLGALVIFITMFVSVVWQIIIMLFGYQPSGGSNLPATFNFGYFALTVLLTAILPGVCEEFTNRGGLLTALRSKFSKKKTIILVGIAFGLFHQNITQVFYASLLGALLAFLVLETQSIYPAMIVHFMNNFMSLLIDNGTTYNWPVIGGLYNFIDGSISMALSALALVILAAFGLLFAIVKISRKSRKKDFYLELNNSARAKLTLGDNVFFIGAIIVTAVSTFMTFIFGI